MLERRQSPSDAIGQPEGPLELSIVLPCLNESDTLATCVRAARRALDATGVRGEIVVADNGSTDDSVAIAHREGAVVAMEAERGYGAALRAGIAAARGRFVLMADADASYDLSRIAPFLDPLREGADLVQGCRFPSGGGRIEPGAMPLLHRLLGNPILSFMVRRMFRSPVRDVYCGMRAFRRDMIEQLDLRSPGMEYAVEMIIKASLFGKKIVETPITLHRDGRKSHAPHLRTFRDGWRTVRFFLMLSPRWLFLVPGAALVAFGFVLYALAMPAVDLFGVILDAHTLIVASLAILVGYQSITFGVFAKSVAVAEGILPPDPRLERFLRVASLERGLGVGAALVILGTVLLTIAFGIWRRASFGALEYPITMRLVVPGFMLAALGAQTVFSVFFASILQLRRR